MVGLFSVKVSLSIVYVAGLLAVPPARSYVIVYSIAVHCAVNSTLPYFPASIGDVVYTSFSFQLVSAATAVTFQPANV